MISGQSLRQFFGIDNKFSADINIPGRCIAPYKRFLDSRNLADMFPFGYGTISHTKGVLIDVYKRQILDYVYKAYNLEYFNDDIILYN